MSFLWVFGTEIIILYKLKMLLSFNFLCFTCIYCSIEAPWL